MSGPNDHAEGFSESAVTRFIYRPLDAVLTSSLRPDASFVARLGAVARPRSSHYDRVGNLARLAAAVLPGPVGRARALLHRPELLPLRAASVQPVGFGTGTTVFLVEGEAGRHVVKVYRRTVGRRSPELIRAAREYRSKYERMAGWFGGLVLPALFLVVHGPLLRRPAVACLQRYVGSRRRDLLGDPDGASVLALARGAEGFRREVVFLARRTREFVERERAFPDILGEGNLVVVEEGGRPRLILLDYGAFDLRRPQGLPVLRRLDSALARLERLARSLGDGAG
ncbi:MAG TPA: hypothetical protein VFI25_07235 [Planctomycetota bacterium]|jgi:hypothetical protein|nr:hypothetical protein [Planctomycetota bacterium]